MAKAIKKEVTETKVEEPEITEVVMPEETVNDVIEVKDSSIPEEPKGQTEVDFLQRILHIQHTGGFGRHLDGIINERIKELNG